MTMIEPKILRKDGKIRQGKGFSRKELRKAGTNSTEARRLDVPVDSKRRTLHEENVESLKAFLQTKKASSKPKRKPKS